MHIVWVYYVVSDDVYALVVVRALAVFSPLRLFLSG